MSTVVKDLGAVSAYAYAVEKGYTGTEAEFAELMADYAEVGQRAEDAADSALESKTAAETAATTATNKASEATTAATTATNKAGEASTSASTATSAKDTAVSASQTATSKATEATTAAATATSAATTATTAKDDAVSAKTAAQTAQTGAETAAASVSASAAQIATNTSDITELKSGLTAVYDGDPSVSIRANMELGNIAINTSGWAYSASNTRVRTKQGYTIKLYKGDVIGLSDYSNATFYLGWKLPNGTYDRKGWNEADYTVKADGEYVVCMRNKTEATLTDASVLSDLFFVKQTGLADVDAMKQALIGYSQVTENLILQEDEESGYLTNSGTIQVATANKEMTSAYIDVAEGEVLYFLAGMKAAFWSVACFYNASKQMIGNRYYFSINENDDAYTVNGYHVKRTWFIVPTGATYIRISYRTLNGCYRLLARASAITNHLFDGTLFRSGTNHIKSIAHKGFEQPYPENTKLSFWGAVKAGFDACETDIRFTSDNVPVCLHDASINATARNADGSSVSGTVNIASITYEDALMYDFGYWKAGAIFSGQKIPTFEEYLEICRNGGIEAYIEIKTGTASQIKSVTDIVVKYGMTDKCTFIGDVSILAEVASNLPSARLGSIVNTITTADIDNLLALKNSSNEVFMDANSEYLTDALINECIANGLPLEAWTLNKISSIASLNPYVTGVTSGAVVASDALSNSITF